MLLGPFYNIWARGYIPEAVCYFCTITNVNMAKYHFWLSCTQKYLYADCLFISISSVQTLPVYLCWHI